MEKAIFKEAEAVWIDETETNLHVMLRAEIKKGGADIIKVASSCYYQIFINNRYIAFGPARAGRGFFRVDEVDISKKLDRNINEVKIIAVYYGVKTYSAIMQKPFVTCEIINNGEIVAATGHSSFEIYKLCSCEQNVPRFSFQRGFVESYDLTCGEQALKKSEVRAGDKKYIPRNVPYPTYERKKAERFISRGKCSMYKPEQYKRFWYEKETISETDSGISKELQDIHYSDIYAADGDRVALNDGEFAIAKFDKEYTGMISFKVVCDSAVTLYVTYDEMLTDETVDARRFCCNAVIKYRLNPGEYEFTAFEPMSMKYVCFSVFGGKTEISGVKLIEYKHTKSEKKINIADPALKRIYEAAEETFCQNSVDIYMDCPSRERAGWLCDSFFSARAEKFFTDGSSIEKNFLENFLMEETYGEVPKGMFPMCYPADTMDGGYIPNWAMWLVLELEEYYNRTSDGNMIENYKKRIYDLIAFFEKYENEAGLLQNLDSWVFVDWSESNNHVQDVSFPTNMLYAYMLEKAGSLYGDISFIKKSEKIRNEIRKQSFNGEFFCDNLVFDGKSLVKSGVCTESCQYYAFFTKTASQDDYPILWNKLIDDFGVKRIKSGKYPEIGKSNAFIGNFLRLELLRENHMYAQLTEEIKDNFGYMAERTGTLWEKVDSSASMNHGFAGYVAVLIAEAVM